MVGKAAGAFFCVSIKVEEDGTLAPEWGVISLSLNGQ